MNQNNQQLQQSNQVSQEELAKTQVLNLNDVQAIAKFERKTSKRPAIMLAIAGLLSITVGLAYPSMMTALDGEPKPNISNRVEEEPPVEKVVEKMTSCSFVSPENPDGTSGKAVYNLIFNENDELQHFTMTFSLNALPGNVNGQTAVQKYYTTYKKLDDIPIDGYTITTTTSGTGMSSTASIDLTRLNKANLTADHTANYFASVPFNLGDSKETVTQQLAASNYICE